MKAHANSLLPSFTLSVINQTYVECFLCAGHCATCWGYKMKEGVKEYEESQGSCSVTKASRGQSSAKERGQQWSSRDQGSKQCIKLQRTILTFCIKYFISPPSKDLKQDSILEAGVGKERKSDRALLSLHYLPQAGWVQDAEVKRDTLGSARAGLAPDMNPVSTSVTHFFYYQHISADIPSFF